MPLLYFAVFPGILAYAVWNYRVHEIGPADGRLRSTGRQEHKRERQMIRACARFGRIHTFYRLLLLVLALGVPAMTSAEVCDPEEHQWSSSRFYPEGAVVFYNDHWYESREIHEGMEPGITFDWRRLHSVPDCGRDGEAPAEPIEAADVEKGVTSAGGSAEYCQRPEHWLFATRYSEGSQVSHGGKIWQATEETKGDMPGVKEPARWKLVEDHCAIQSQPAL